jgi:vancomycin permeability regulator SanA
LNIIIEITDILFATSLSPLLKPEKTDVIVVLGAAVWPGGIPSPSLRRRVLHAVELLQCGRSDVIIFSGGIGKNPPSEAQIMRQLAIEQGVSENDIIMEEAAKSTLDSAVACSRIICEKGWATALIVTDRYHLIRSAFLFRRFGIRVICSAPEDSGLGPRRWKWWYLYTREFLAFPWSIFRVYVRKIRDLQNKS